MTHITTTTSPDATSVLTTWLNRNFVRDLEYTLQHQKFTTKAIIPKGAGNKGRFLTFAAPASPNSYSGLGGGNGTAAITEGSTTANEITAITQTSTDITIAEFGEYTKVGTLYEYAAVPGLRQELLKRLRDGAAFSLDSFVRSKALLTTTRLYARNDQVGATTVLTAAEAPALLGATAIMAARKTLFANLAQGFQGLEGHPRNHYAAVVTPDQEQDITTEYTTQRVTWAQSVTNVPGIEGQLKWVNGYMGSIYQTAVYATNNYTTLTMSVSSEIAIVYADGGVGAMAFQDMNPEIILNDINSPYKNMNTFAWHCMFGAGLIDAARVVKIYSAT